jgi:hypothetical protein
MKNLSILAAAVALAVPGIASAETTQAVHEATEQAAAPVELRAGTMLYASNGSRLASVYRVTESGDPQVIMNGRLVTVPAATISDVDGKVTTSLSKRDVAKAR